MLGGERQIATVLVERLIGCLRLLSGDALVAAHLHQCLEHAVARHAGGVEQTGGGGGPAAVGRLCQHDEQMFGADIIVAHALGFGLGQVREHADIARHADFAYITAYLRLCINFSRYVRQEL